MREWQDQRVFVTGGAGFVGTVLRETLAARGCGHILAPRSTELDLTDQLAVRHYLQRERPTMVVHLAAVVGGIGANAKYPGTFFYDNAIMGTVLMEEARRVDVE